MSKLNVNIGPTDMQPIICKECDGMYFRQVMAINKVSKLLTVSDKDTMVPVPVTDRPLTPVPRLPKLRAEPSREVKLSEPSIDRTVPPVTLMEVVPLGMTKLLGFVSG